MNEIDAAYIAGLFDGEGTINRNTKINLDTGCLTLCVLVWKLL